VPVGDRWQPQFSARSGTHVARMGEWSDRRPHRPVCSVAVVKLGRDRFRVRECYLSPILSDLRIELLHAVHPRPLVSVAGGCDRYSVGYPPALPRHLDACYGRAT
jgi:hypothetical protein